jgi:hypothetical protein
MTTIQEALTNHFNYNMVPTLPATYVEPAMEALKWVKQGEFEVIVYLPSDINPRPLVAKTHQDFIYVTASDLVDALKIDSPEFYNLLDA